MGEMGDLFDDSMERIEGLVLSFTILVTVALFVLLVAGAAYIFWVGPTVVWYVAKYRVFTDKVYIDPKPTDCDLWHAPIGFKSCHYERLVWSVIGSGGKPEYRYDPKTDELIDLLTNEVEADPYARHDSVHVSWVKKSY